MIIAIPKVDRIRHINDFERFQEDVIRATESIKLELQRLEDIKADISEAAESRKSFETYTDIITRKTGGVEEYNVHGGLHLLGAAGAALNVGASVTRTTGTGKIVINVTTFTVGGTVTITGDTVDRTTGVITAGDTENIYIDAVTIDSSSTGGRGGAADIHGFTGAYITNKWFNGSTVLSTTGLLDVVVSVYNVAFEQFGDEPKIELDQLDITLQPLHADCEFDAYLYSLVVYGRKCDITLEADVHLGTDGTTPVADVYERLKRKSIGKKLDGTKDGIWLDMWFLAAAGPLVEDLTVKIWYKRRV